MKTIKLLAILFISALTLSSCSDDDHDDDDHDHEEELITTVNYTLTNGDDVVTLSFVDLDGEGGADGTYTVSGSLTANTTYIGAIELLNATEDPAEDITVEVKDEGDEHEFFYSSNINGVSIEKTDEDGDGNPIGIETTLTTGDAGVGTLTIVLKHEPTKPNDNNADNAGGSTDVEVTFAISVQ
ncbi:type 1 periplasmic binding fold superfamily protein [Polaribacter reichenbachii]|uniref:Type 1 periplasmic binding fold superfamily protein n=1 Tax=Polaribacter reichenbachii TaxID=996801 RepID=A0A1B8TQ62_9FLAO|nr:type 1 periplasmic binding fold superfamily protein [Polaribacter reichenbachii]APZ48141.1 type 1 periplasmic binding fold superfamily protein [Polaribacter reichenbachii]AUC20408.1 type 1 periplasmic binding fold superfamily protein [Polaribacter reichenbachii]OBY61796.1 type 1 periplasmic binding fold superfamily protein [Polaribacter reichenbachii]